MLFIKLKNYSIIIIISIILLLFILNNCKSYNVDNYKLANGEKILLNKSLLKDIKINGKIVLLDLTDDIIKNKKVNETTDDFLKSGNYIYNEEEVKNFREYIDYFYNYVKQSLEEKFVGENLNNEIIFNINNEESDQTTIFIEVIEYSEGEYNLIKNELTKFKISVKLFRKNLINNNNLLFIKNYKCKPSILYPTEKSRIKEIANLCSKDIINFFKRGLK